MKKWIVRIIIIILQYISFRYIYSYEYGLHNYTQNFYYMNGIFAIFLIFNFREGMLSLKNLPIWEELRKHIVISIEFISVIWITLYLTATITNFDGFLGHLKVNLFLSLIFLILNFMIYVIVRKIFSKFLNKNILILGIGETAKDIAISINKNSFLNYNIVGFLDTNESVKSNIEEVAINKERILGKYDELHEIIKKYQVEEIIISLPEIDKKEFKILVDNIGNSVEKVTYVPKFNQAYTFETEVHDYDGLLAISSKTGVVKTPMAMIKRLFDIVTALFGLLIFGIIYLIFGRKIKADGGPAMYAQERIGKDLKPFKIYKFRSMYADADKRLEELLKDDAIREEYYRTFKLKDDPRITKVGKFLRKTSLDEFPQFINVLKGDMSLIGPRPIVQKELDEYYKDFYGKKVFAYKPGITGMWQSHGRSNVEDYDERIELDLYYTRNWSLWLDAMILIKTFINVLTKKDAY